VLHELSPIGGTVLVGLRQDRRKIWIVYEEEEKKRRDSVKVGIWPISYDFPIRMV